MEKLTELLESYSLESAHPSYLFSLQGDLSLREGCTGPSLSEWESLSPRERLPVLERRWLHIISAMWSTPLPSKDNELLMLANNAWTCFKDNKESPEVIKALWKALVAIPEHEWRKSSWRCCSAPSEAATRGRPEPTKTTTPRDRTPTPCDRTPTPPPSIDEEEAGTDRVRQPYDEPHPSTPTTRDVRTPIPAPDEASSLTSTSRTPRPRLDRPSPAPSATRERGDEVSVTQAGSDAEMREPVAPRPLISCPCGLAEEFPSYRKLCEHGLSCPAIPSSARAKANFIRAKHCIFCDRELEYSSLSNHEKKEHYIFPCSAIATTRGHSKCSQCKSLQQKGRSKAIIDPIDYLMSERQDAEPPEAKAVDPSRLHAAVERFARSICPEERDLLLRCHKNTLATILHDALARTEALTETSQHADGGIGKLLPNGHVQLRPIDTNTASTGTGPEHDATWRPNNEQPSVRQSIEVHTTATISDLPSLASSAWSASERPTTNHGLPATPPFFPPSPTLGKRKRDEQSPPRGSTSSDRMRQRGLADNDALVSIVCSVSSHARDPLPSQNDDVPEIMDQTAARLSPPAITAATTQHVQCAQPELGAVPDASTTGVSRHAEMGHGGAMEPEAVAATPGKTLPDILPEERIIAPSADEQSEIPSIPTDNKQPDQLVEGSDDITPRPFFVHEDQNFHHVRDENASPRPHHARNHFDYASPSGISQPTATSGQPLPPQSAEKGIPTSLPMPIYSNSTSHYAATAAYLPDGDRRPNTRQRILAGDTEFSQDSASTPQFAHHITPGYNSTGFADFPVTRAAGLGRSLHSHPAEGQVSYFNERTASHLHGGFFTSGSVSYKSSASEISLASGQDLPSLMVPNHGYQQGSVVNALKGAITNDGSSTTAHHLPPRVAPASSSVTNRNDWQKVALTQISPPTQHVTPMQVHSCHDSAAGNLLVASVTSEEILSSASVSTTAAIGAVLGPKILDRIEKSHFRIQEKDWHRHSWTTAVLTHEYTNRWVIMITMGQPESPDTESTDVNALKDTIATAMRASHAEKEAIAIKRLSPADEKGDHIFGCTIDLKRGADLVKSLHDLSWLFY